MYSDIGLITEIIKPTEDVCSSTELQNDIKYEHLHKQIHHLLMADRERGVFVSLSLTLMCSC